MTSVEVGAGRPEPTIGNGGSAAATTAVAELRLRVEHFAAFFVVVGALADEFEYEFGMVAKENSDLVGQTAAASDNHRFRHLRHPW
jgi:hypothetical protein